MKENNLSKNELADMNEKPIIRHCRNCKWCTEYPDSRIIECQVKYKNIWKQEQRREALFCRHYKQKDN